MTNKFDNLNKKELIEILNQGNLSEEDFLELIELMKGKGLNGSIMAVDDPDSEEGKAAVEYIEFHKKIPEDYYCNMPEKEIEWAKEILFSKKAGIKDKKRALIILAHTGRIDVYESLEKYEKNPDPELKIWLNMAIQECQSFLKSDILEKPVINIGKVTKVSRNDPCPCGSGKKYKKCCLPKV